VIMAVMVVMRMVVDLLAVGVTVTGTRSVVAG